MSERSIAFTGGLVGLAAVLALGLLEAVGTRYANEVLEPTWTLPTIDITVVSAVISLAVLAGILAVLRWEGVSLADIGMSPRLAAAGAALVFGIFAVFNLLAAGLAVAVGQPEAIGYHWIVSPGAALVWLFIMFVLAGIVEEVLFRGYLQTKFIALLEGPHLARVGVGIALASVLFSLYHVPRIVMAGPPDGMTAGAYLVSLGVSGLVYGLLYEWTNNLWVPILVHTFGNAPGTAGLVFVVAGGWPMWAAGVYQALLTVTVILGVLAYRRWGRPAGYYPVWTERISTVRRWSPADS